MSGPILGYVWVVDKHQEKQALIKGGWSQISLTLPSNKTIETMASTKFGSSPATWSNKQLCLFPALTAQTELGCQGARKVLAIQSLSLPCGWLATEISSDGSSAVRFLELETGTLAKKSQVWT